MTLDALNTLPVEAIVHRYGVRPIAARALAARRPLTAPRDLAFLARLAPADHARLAGLFASAEDARVTSNPYLALVDGLTWQRFIDFAAHDRYAADREARLFVSLRRFAAAGIGAGTLARFESLAPDHRRRLALAPAVGYRLFDGPTDDFVFLRDAVAAEWHLQAGTPPERPLWTATRDARLVPGAALARPEGARLDYTPPGAGPWLAPRLTAELILELPHDQLSPAEARAHVALFAAALDEIDAIAPLAGSLVRRVSRVWVVERCEGWSAESEQRWAGRVIWGEPTKRHADEGLAAGAVHEALHSLVYAIEAEASLFCGERAAGHATSGWTGRSLHLHAWVHACLVWYALAGFWRQALDRRVGDPDLAARQHARCRAGFVAEGAAATWREVRPVLSDAAAEALDRVWDEMAV